LLPTQYWDATALADQVNQAVGGADLTMTGHSLGGGLAAAAALETNRPAVTFNAAGLNSLTELVYGASSYTSRTVNDSVQGEIVTEFQSHLAVTPEAFGELYQLRPAAVDAQADAITLHLMPAVLHALGL
jgi:acetyl esterase/lipase